MNENGVLAQRKFGVRLRYQFEAKQLTYALRDYSGELQFAVPYEAIDTLQSSTLIVNNRRLFSCISLASLFAILVIGGLMHVGGLNSAGMALLLGVWLVAILLASSLRPLAIRYTLLPVLAEPNKGKRLRIIAGRDHDAILAEIKAGWRARIRELYGAIDFGNDAEKEIARFVWLKQRAVITEDEYQVLVEKLRTYAAHNRPEATEQRLN